MLKEEFRDIEAEMKEMQDLEQEGDILTHGIINKLNTSVIDPVFRKNIYNLASKLDDVVDLIWDAVDKLSVFRLQKPTKEVIDISKNLIMMIDIMSKAMSMLKEKRYEQVQDYCIEIEKQENKIDGIFTNALEKLFDESKDPVFIIKWKEIYEYIEDASDKCKVVANILKEIAINQS
jgi:uncharacterized protein Yka (UPF0111/DUF47 family)